MSRFSTGDTAGFWAWLGTLVGVVAAAFWIVGVVEAVRSGADWPDWIGGAVVLTLVTAGAIARALTVGRPGSSGGPSRPPSS